MIKYNREIKQVEVFVTKAHAILKDNSGSIIAVRKLSDFVAAKSVSPEELNITFLSSDVKYTWYLFMPIENHFDFITWLLNAI